MIAEKETFNNSWPFTANYFQGSGFKQHYVDIPPTNGADKPDETFVLVHGEPTWGYIWRNFIPRLSKLGRVVVPDHMGFGKSETPQNRAYSAQDHCENLEALLLDRNLNNVTLVMQDWGGIIGTHFALKNPERIKRMFYIDSIPRVGFHLPASLDIEKLMAAGPTPWQAFFESEKFSPVMNHLDHTILSVLKIIGLENNAVITEDWLNAYSSPFPTPEECIGAKRFPLNLTTPETDNFLNQIFNASGAIAALAKKPAAACHGEQDRAVPVELAKAMYREIWPALPLTMLPNTGHFAQEDSPDLCLSLIEHFVNTP